MDSTNYVSLLSTMLPFWNQLTAKQCKLLTDHVTTLTFQAGDTIHCGNSDCIGVLLIKSGTLRVFMLSEEGREITLYRLSQGDVCILSASCVMSSITFDVHVSAETNCELLQISSCLFSQLSKENIYVENFAHKLATERFSDVMWAMQQILFMSFDKRLAIFLNDEMIQSNDTTIHMTHEQIAKYLGSAREVVSRMLKYFANEGIVELSRGGIEIKDKQKLRHIALGTQKGQSV